MGVVVLLVVMAIGAISASATTPSMTKGEASAVLERPAGIGALNGEVGAPGRLAPFVPALAPGVSRAPGVAAGGTIFYDGFEGAALWTEVLGDPTWAGTNYRAAVGSWSGYCARSSIIPPGPYANNMDAQLIKGPLDLSAVTSATFQYKLYYNTEANRDYVQALVSIDGQRFYGWQYSGNSLGWEADSMDLTNVPTLGNVCGRSQVWIAFFFESDPTVTYEGAYVDEVLVSGGGSVAAETSLHATSPVIVPYAGSVDLEGRLTDASSGALLPNQEVELLYSQEDSQVGQWYLLDTATSSTGVYSLGASNIQRLTYLSLVFDPDNQNVWSWPYVKVQAFARLTPPAVPSRVRAGVMFTSYGTLKPRHTAKQNRQGHTKATIERFVNGGWRTIRTLTADMYRNTSSLTKFYVELFFPPMVALGKWRIRAVHQDGDHLKTTSSWRTFTVR